MSHSLSQSIEIKSLYGEEYAPQGDAVLLINLGSPASPSVADVRRYLGEFLMDGRVISLPYLMRLLLVRGLIVPFRAKHSARNYSKIWEADTQTFPLVRHSAQMAEALANRLGRSVALAMRYGAPSMDDALRTLVANGIKRVQILPLYPHYAQSSFETAMAYTFERREELSLPLDLVPISPFYNHPSYRKALAGYVRERLPHEFDKLVISMHGIPLSHLHDTCRSDNGNPRHCLNTKHSPEAEATCYRLHCERTALWLAEDLALSPERVELVYQSRLGRQEWIKPYFAMRIREWIAEGAKRVVVVSPGFVCDCLETLEEIEGEYATTFRDFGGEQFDYIPCLGADPLMIDALADLINTSNDWQNTHRQ